MGDAVPGLVGGPSPAPVSVPPADAQAPGVASPPPIQIDLVDLLHRWYEDGKTVDGVAWGQTFQEYIEEWEQAVNTHLPNTPYQAAMQHALLAQAQQGYSQQQLAGLQSFSQGALIGGVGGALLGGIFGGLLGGAIKKPDGQ